MLKFLIILILIVYAFYRLSSFLFKVVFGGTARNQFNPYQQHRQNNGRNPNNMDVNSATRNKRKRRNYPGGEYVDFEEIK